MPRGWEKISVHIKVKRRFRDLKLDRMRTLKNKKMSDNDFLIELLDIYLSNPQKGSPPSVDTEMSIPSPAIDDDVIDDQFPCLLLCKKFMQCTSHAMDHRDEISADNCYTSKYPYLWTTPDGRTVRVCKFMNFNRNFPHDSQNPYPTCIAKQKDVPIQLPKDRIMRNPQHCWTCYRFRKKQRDKLYKQATSPIKHGLGPIYRGNT